MIGRGEGRGDWRVEGIDPKVDLSNEHLGVIGAGVLDRGGLRVVDVQFKSSSLFSRLNGFGLWPQLGVMCGFVTRAGWPEPQNVRAIVRYETPSGAVYRMYVHAE